MTDLATFVASLDLPAGANLELETFQARMLDELGDVTIPTPAAIELAQRRVGRRERMATAIVVALLSGETSTVTLCGDEAQGRLTLERAAHMLQRYADLFGIELPAPAAELIRITPGNPRH